MNTSSSVIVLWMLMSVTVSSAWSSSINSIFTTKRITPDSFGFNSNLVDSIANGAQMAMDQCQAAFKWDRWNCPETAFSRRYKHASTKELAYVRAIVAAGVVHAITKNCSKGEIEGCGCNSKLGNQTPLKFTGRDIDPTDFNATKEHEVKWSWGGCSDNVDFANQIAKNFLDELEQDPEAPIHLHNNNVGRELVKQTMVKRCRCHGVSGSCNVQTCWVQVAPFAAIAKKLRERYEKAIRIEVDDTNNLTNDETKEIPAEISTHQLIYIKQSPDYCLPNNATGTKGTKGRSCTRNKLEEATAAEKRSCKNLCRACGMRVKKQKRSITKRCNCKFTWCCEVTCDTCVEQIEEYYCD